ncbi:hypothetical protein EAH79_01670 [Sphingomonas koreensis]|nr:hypothetical protein EAH79_01670 [Sphingomonas koreensis]
MRRLAIALACFSGFVVIPAGAAVGAQDPAKKIARTQDDLPRYSYHIAGKAADFLASDDAAFNAFAEKVAADVDKTLNGYEIEDRGTRRGLLGVLLDIALLRHEDHKAAEIVDQIHRLEDKPDALALDSPRSRALLAARAATGQSSGKAFRQAFTRAYAARLRSLRWSTISNAIKETKTGLQLQTRPVVIGRTTSYVNPALSPNGEIGSDRAWALISARLALREWLPVRAESIAVLTDLIAANRVDKPDIWAARDVTLSADQAFTPVNVAIWDEGVDLSLFPGRLYTDPHPDPRFDLHGLAFDLGFTPGHGPLIALTPAQAAHYPERLADLEGWSDLDAAIDSPAADAFLEKIAAIEPDKVSPFIEELSFFGAFYAHGTHIAGIAAAGNPAIRLATARMGWDWHTIPAAPTEALIARRVAAYQTYADWFRTHGMRVVNMSWGNQPSDMEEALESNGIGKDAAERRVLAKHLFEIDRAGLLAALKSAPDVLFISAAGNSNSDTDFNEDIPSTFELPNLLTVGAVDRAGDEAGFTSYGKTVRVHANGYQVESVVPGGSKLRFSGTSMASPEVVNLAAKLLAVKPALHPLEVIGLIMDGSTASADGRRHLINPKRSMELLGQN